MRPHQGAVSDSGYTVLQGNYKKDTPRAPSTFPVNKDPANVLGRTDIYTKYYRPGINSEQLLRVGFKSLIMEIFIYWENMKCDEHNS